MSRTAMLGLATFLILPSLITRTSTGQSVERMPQNRTLDAQFPSTHAYTIEVWFTKQDKRGTFKAMVFDQSIPKKLSENCHKPLSFKG